MRTGLGYFPDGYLSQPPGLMKRSNLRWVFEELSLPEWEGGGDLACRKRERKEGERESECNVTLFFGK